MLQYVAIGFAIKTIVNKMFDLKYIKLKDRVDKLIVAKVKLGITLLI